MFEKVSILIPYQPDHGPRDKNLDWIKRFYKSFMPKAEVCIGTTNDTLFNRSQAINLAAKQATKPIFVIADGDIFYDPAIIVNAVKLLKKANWVVPFQTVYKISQFNSKRLLDADSRLPAKEELTDSKVIHLSRHHVGMLNVISREKFYAVNGFDERFLGWGGEDKAFACAVDTICGPYTRLEQEIYHLWHPSVGYRNNPNGDNNQKLKSLYYQARGDKEKMKKLISGS